VYVQGKFNVVADALSRIKESPSTALYVGSEDDEDSNVVALNVMETVSRPMLSKSMVSDLIRAYMLLVPQVKLRKSLMHGAHDALVAGHLGFNKAYERLRRGVA
jgi:hypothetical protein